jgi:AraC-like DNA-binding protein
MMLLLNWRRQPNSAVGWLTVWSVATMLLYACHFLYFQHATEFLPVSDSLYTVCNLVVYPLYLIYISEQTDLQPLSSKPLLVGGVWVLGLLGGVIIFTLYAVMDESETHEFINTFLYNNRSDGLEGTAWLQYVAHRTCQTIFAVEVVVVAMIGYRKIKRYNATLEQLCADTDDKSLRPIGIILQLLVVTGVLSFAVNYIGRQHFADSLWLAVPALVFSVLLFSITWVGLNYHTTLRDISNSKVTTGTTVEENKPASQNDQRAMKNQLEQLMMQERIFLRQDLRLDDVALMLGTNRTYLLATLRNEMGMTFKEYINRQRIAYAEELMRRVPNISKIEVASQSGYGTPSSFYRNMKAYGHSDV